MPAIIEPVKARKMRLVESGFSGVAIAGSDLLEVAGVLMMLIQFETVTIVT